MTRLLGRRWVLRGLLVGLVVLHGGLVVRNFPLRSVTSGHPLIQVELHFHLAGAMEGHDFLAQRHHLWGYSPRYMAGYPFGVWNSIGTRGYEMASTLLPFPLPVAFYLWVVLSSFLPPLGIGLAALLSTRDRPLAALGLAVALGVWQLGNVVTYFWTSGMIAFPFVEAISVLYAALICRSWTSREWRWPLAAGVCLGAIFWLHQLVLLSAGMATLAVLAVGRPAGGTWRGLLRLAAAAAVALLVSLPWLLLLLEWRDTRGYMYLARIPSGLKCLIADFFSDRRYRFHFDRRPLLHALTVLAALGTAHAFRRREAAVKMYGLTALGLLVCAYAFSLSRFLDQTEPYRYLGSAILFAAIPAAGGARRLGQLLREAQPAGRAAAAALGLMLLPSLTAYGFDFAYRVLRPQRGLDARQLEVATWLNGRGGLAGRVLCDDSKLGNVLPYYTGAQMIGGTIGDESVLPHSWAGAGVKSAFGGAGLEGDADGSGVREHLRLYNVEYAVTFTKPLVNRLERLEGVCRKAAQIGPYAVFAVNPAALGWVWGREGEAGIRVKAEPNRLRVEGAPAGRFVLKYHYLRTLTSSPGTRLYPERLLDDPVPFIGVDNKVGLERLEIWNAYR